VRAAILDSPGNPLHIADVPVPDLEAVQVLIRVRACGVCRTDLHVVDGELRDPKLPLIPGHQIVGEVVETGERVERFAPGDRVGVPWLGWTCGRCRYCLSGRENLCNDARFTGYQIDGGYAEYAVADYRFCFPISDAPDLQVAPLLCAGLIGYRSLKMTRDAERLGLYGFGAAAHIVIQVARHQGRQVFAFTRDGDEEAQSFVREMGALWAGDSSQPPPEELDAAIIFAPVGALVPTALRAVA
jgi:alcohol dehydrogenase, propanol-preferring